MLFEICEVVEVDKIRISPEWKWNDLSGDTVIINSINDVEIERYIQTLDKNGMSALLFDKLVELSCPIVVEENVILCDIRITS